MRVWYLIFLRIRNRISPIKDRNFFSKEFEAFVDSITIDEAHHKILNHAKNNTLHSSYKEYSESLYSTILKRSLVDFFSILKKTNSLFNADVEMAFVRGSLSTGCAVPLHLSHNGKLIPRQAASFLSMYYIWALTQKNINTQHPRINSFIFNHSFSSDIDIVIYLKNDSKELKESISVDLQDMFIEKFGFSPLIDCRYRLFSNIAPIEVLKGFCVYGKDRATFFLRNSISKKTILNYEIYKASHHYSNILLREKHWNDITNNWQSLSDKVVRYGMIDTNLRFLPPEKEIRENSWYVDNKEFFHAINESKDNTIVATDSTHKLHDGKGSHKKSDLTILQVSGIKTKFGFIKAKNVVLKVRGINSNKKNLDNYFDLIKEHSLSLFLKKKGVGFTPCVGGLLSNISNIMLDGVNIGKVDIGAGFFMENIKKEGFENVTFRVQNLTSLLRLIMNFVFIKKSLILKGVNLNIFSFLSIIFALKVRGINITTCDLSVFIDKNKNVDDIIIFDYEKTSLGSMTRENHPIIPSFVDIKKYLLKRGKSREKALDYLFRGSSLDTRNDNFPYDAHKIMHIKKT
jgi:hypothetical protein